MGKFSKIFWSFPVLNKKIWLSKNLENLVKFHDIRWNLTIISSNFLKFWNFLLSLLQLSKFLGNFLGTFKFQKFQTHNMKATAKDLKNSILHLPIIIYCHSMILKSFCITKHFLLINYKCKMLFKKFTAVITVEWQ